MSYQRHAWGELRLLLQTRYEAVPFWTEDEARAAVNEALAVWNLLTARWQRRETLPSVGGQIRYTASSLLLWRTRIEWDGVALISSSRSDLDQARPAWRSESTSSGPGVPSRPVVWAPISLRSFDLWPAGGPGHTLTIDGVAATPILAEDTDFVDLGDEHLTILLDYALHVLSFSKAGPAFAATQDLFQRFLQAAAEENSQLTASRIFRYLAGLDQARAIVPLRGAPVRSVTGATS